MIVVSGNPARRSLLIHWHAERNASFSEGNDVVEHYGDPDREASTAARVGLCDLSLLPRVGMTGPGAMAVLNEQDFDLPDVPNVAVRQINGDAVARLSMEEFLHLSLSQLQPGAATLGAVPVSPPAQRAYRLPRADSHSLFALCGHHAAQVLAKLCAVDCRSGFFADGKVAQTSIARQNGIVMRHDLGTTLNYLVLTATPATEYLWECLLDAMSEYSGSPIGAAALRVHNKIRQR